MAVVSTNIGTAKTIRDFLTNNSDKINTIKSGTNTLNNVDVIWDGANYYLSYTTTNDNEVVIEALDNMLPLTITFNQQEN